MVKPPFYGVETMAVEIERKFLVTGDAWRNGASGIRVRQGYLSVEKARTVRIRLTGNQAFLTIKGSTSGVSRAEYEYAIPVHEAEELLETMCLRPQIEKTRYSVSRSAHVWEIDVFEGKNVGLIVAEIELTHPDEPFDRPEWLGEEVSQDPRYFNSNLLAQPFSTW